MLVLTLTATPAETEVIGQARIAALAADSGSARALSRLGVALVALRAFRVTPTERTTGRNVTSAGLRQTQSKACYSINSNAFMTNMIRLGAINFIYLPRNDHKRVR